MIDVTMVPTEFSAQKYLGLCMTCRGVACFPNKYNQIKKPNTQQTYSTINPTLHNLPIALIYLGHTLTPLMKPSHKNDVTYISNPLLPYMYYNNKITKIKS